MSHFLLNNSETQSYQFHLYYDSQIGINPASLPFNFKKSFIEQECDDDACTDDEVVKEGKQKCQKDIRSALADLRKKKAVIKNEDIS